MKRFISKSVIGAVLIGTAIVLLSTCATVNELERYSFHGTTLAGEMRRPPPPTIDVDYNVQIDAKNPIGTYFSIATNIAKASYAQKAEKLMKKTLEKMDIPNIVFTEVYDGFVTVLGVKPVDDSRSADYIFNLEIQEYGIKAPGGSVEVQMNVTARLFTKGNRELIWRRDIHVSDPLNPGSFGLGDVVENVVTLATLAELTEKAIIAGFENVTVKIAQKIPRMLEDDLL